MRRLNGLRYCWPYGELPKPVYKVRERSSSTYGSWDFWRTRRAKPTAHFIEKRLKRPRAHSPPPSSTPPTPVSAGNTRNATGPGQRGSAGPQPSTPSLRETKSRTLRETLQRQLPLKEGRMVAFHPPSSGKAADGTSPEDTTWIMARIVKSLSQDRFRYVRLSSQPTAYLSRWYLATRWKTSSPRKTESHCRLPR